MRVFLTLTDEDGIILDRFEVMESAQYDPKIHGDIDSYEFTDSFNAPELSSRIRNQINDTLKRRRKGEL